MKRMICILLAVLFVASVFSGCSKKDASSEGSSSSEVSSEVSSANNSASSQTVSAVKHHVTIDVKNYGTISIELDPTYAPITVANFIELAKSKFYDGLTFHRIIDGFMIQGGDPLGNGKGDSDKKIKGEFSANGVNNPLSHKRGVISMGRLSNDYDSASCQFFIVQTDFPSLDGQYAAFGYVTSGMDIVDKICKNTPVQDGDGTVLKNDQPVITSVKVID